jgi:PKD repeat protein
MYYNPGGSVLFNANLNNTSGFGHIFWSFGDGSSGNGSLIIAHTYTANGTYIATFHYADSITNCNITQSINVVVTNANGGSSNNCVQSINVTPGANGSFTFDAVGSFNAATSFLVWDFGDNTGDYGVTTAHTYSSTGTFNVCVTNYDSLNPCTTPTCTTVNVTSVPTGGNCVQSITVTPGANGLYSFTANFNFNPALADLVWDFGDNTAGLGVNEQHTYTATGTYTVCVTNRDTLNPCFTPTCTTVNVGSIPNTTCSANFVLFPDSTVTGLYYGYNLSTGPATMTYYWDFGDGSSSTAQYPVHNYASSGTYTICLTVLDMPSGCSATYCYTGSIVKSGIHQINILSSPLAVQQATSQTHTMLVYPNPADTYITVPAEGSLQITDATGRMVVLKDVNADARVDVSNLSPGIYYIIHQKDGAKSTGRFVKQ